MARLGGMRERVIVQQEQQVPDTGGGYALTWFSVATVYAKVRPLSGREQVQRGGLESSQMYEVTVRNRVDYSLSTGMRLVWGSKQLNIRNVRNMDERGEFLTCDCESGVMT